MSGNIAIVRFIAACIILLVASSAAANMRATDYFLSVLRDDPERACISLVPRIVTPYSRSMVSRKGERMASILEVYCEFIELDNGANIPVGEMNLQQRYLASLVSQIQSLVYQDYDYLTYSMRLDIGDEQACESRNARDNSKDVESSAPQAKSDLIKKILGSEDGSKK